MRVFGIEKQEDVTPEMRRTSQKPLTRNSLWNLAIMDYQKTWILP